ncbi:MAG: dihydroorotase, partial [Candidatus Eutrophobiaceae bacterium]
TMLKIDLSLPDDMHLHLRDGAYMSDVVGFSSAQFGRAIVMPNLDPPVTTCAQACAYRKRIRAALPVNDAFNPLMTLYLTDNMPISELELLSKTPEIIAIKYYPANSTTFSQKGITRIENTYAALEYMEEMGIPLLLHGEAVDPDVDIFDREATFIDLTLLPVHERFPRLRMVLEHISTREAVEFIESAPAHIGATITPQHMLFNRNTLFRGGLRPHHYCAPILKAETHRAAILEAATSGNPKYFLGTDSAPHPQDAKESHCASAGLFTAPQALSLYAEAFEQANHLDRLEGFASHYGADFYSLPRNQGKIALLRTEQDIPLSYPLGEKTVIPLRAGGTCAWQIKRDQ